MGIANLILLTLICIILFICYGWVAAVLALIAAFGTMLWMIDAWAKDRRSYGG